MEILSLPQLINQMHTYIHGCIYVYMYIYDYIYIYIHINEYVYTCIYLHTLVYLFMSRTLSTNMVPDGYG